MKEKHNNWRLPTIKELQNMFDYEEGSFSIENLNKKNSLWSSTIYSQLIYYVWSIRLYDGLIKVDNKDKLTNSFYCVRKTKKGKLKWSKYYDKNLTWIETISFINDLNHKEV